ncbi:MAG: hypothetical protein HFF39_08735 [Lawsonibacter sp.]|nr:hypothetical protein [Lawsonibacter sp.]
MRHNRSAGPAVRGKPRPVFAAGIGLTAPILMLLWAISPSVTSWLWTLPARQAGAGEALPARLLLEGYLLWYLVLLAVLAVGLALGIGLSLLLIVLGVRFLRRNGSLSAMAAALPPPEFPEWDGEEDSAPPLSQEEQWRDEMRARLEVQKRKNIHAAMGRIAAGVWAMLIVPGLLIACAGTEDILSLPGLARADLEEIEAGQTQTLTVWISPKSRPARLPGPYTAGQKSLSTRYGIIGWDTGGAWVMVYVPDGMDFSLTGTRLYQEDKNQAWNMENAQRFSVSFTSRLKVVTEITPVD